MNPANSSIYPAGDPAAVVRGVLTRSTGRPLDPAVRAFFEPRFGCDLGRVRVHTGRDAVEAAAVLDARAFTVGWDVVFGDGEYCPDRASGKWLLAHELAHAVQQRGRVAELPERVGRPDDPMEFEADAAAATVLAGLGVPSLSPDPGLALRRAINIKTATAGIDVVAGQAAPDVALIPGSVGPVAVCNLTRNFNSDPTLVDWAFNLIGHVKVDLGPTDDLSTHTFGYVQYMRHNFLGIFYAGRVPREGRIGMLLDPVIGHDYMLDCSPSTTRPFMWPPGNNSQFNSGEETANMGDHPVLSVRQKEQNVTTGVENFLFHMIDDREAWSIFTVQNPAGAFQHLAHVRWTLRYEFKFKWKNGTPLKENKSTFSMGTPVLGAPNDKDLQPILAAVSASQTPIANEKAKEAMRTVRVPPNPNRSDNAGWFNNVPGDFFT
ncbi:MAG TPA: DUF4157 domain-containing protein [Bryobacteraceae bacterium]|nr:DUF4157 domain-containing protein [Bryobacteraceae bacterium]